jgi:hypothetical protein
MHTSDEVQQANRERWRLLRQIDQLLEMPMVVLGFAWLALLIWELTAGLTPLWEAINTGIWTAFVVDFAVKLVLARRSGNICGRTGLSRSHWRCRRCACSESRGRFAYCGWRARCAPCDSPVCLRD